jgi:phosphate uptake regulator
MHIRRLVKSGASSFTVSLPKGWLDRNNLKKGSLVYISEKSSHELSISPEKVEEKQEVKEITINIDGKKMDAVEREITSAYVNNYNTIRIMGNSLIEKTKELRRILHNFTALEITEQKATAIVAKDLLNLKEVSINDIIRRMDMIIRSMMQDLADIRNKKLSENIHFRDFDVNKLYFLIFRLVKGALNDPLLASHFEIDNTRALGIWYLTVNLENISDCFKNISVNLNELGESFNFGELGDIYGDIRQSYLDIMRAYHKKDKDMAHKVAGARTGIITKCINYAQKNSRFNILDICDNLKETENLVCNIARIIIDEST